MKVGDETTKQFHGQGHRTVREKQDGELNAGLRYLIKEKATSWATTPLTASPRISAGYVSRLVDRDTMNAGIKRMEPGMDIGEDLGEEWRMAERLSEADS